MNNFGKYLKEKLLLSFTDFFFYLCVLISILFCYFNYFILGGFFSGNGSTSLKNFYNAFPFISIILIPALGLKSKNEYFEFLLPFTGLKLIIQEFLSVLLQIVAILICLLPLIPCLSLFGKVEFSQLISSNLVLILYSACAVSITLFCFNTTKSVSHGFFLSTIILSISYSIHLFSEAASTSSVLMKIIRAFSFSYHFNNASIGLIDSRDIIYLSTITVFFLFFNFYNQEKAKGKKINKDEKLKLFLSLLILIFTLLNSTRYYFVLDLTPSKNYSLSNYSKKLVNNTNSPLSITYYRSALLKSLYPETKNISDFLKLYSESKNVSVLTIDPEKTGRTTLLDNYGIYPRQIKTSGTNKTEYVNVYSTIVIEYEGNWEVIPFVLSNQTLEYDIASRLLHLITHEDRFVNLLSGSEMTFDSDLNYVIPWLSSQGFIVNELNKNIDLQKELESAEKFGDVLAVFGSSRLTKEDVFYIKNYLEKGKSILFFASPYKKDLEQTWNLSEISSNSLIDFLQDYGIFYSPGIIQDISCSRITMESEGETPENGSRYTKILNYPYWVELLPQPNAPEGITLFWPNELNFENDSKIKPLLYTSNKSFLVKPDLNNPEKLFETNPFLLNQQKIDLDSEETRNHVVGACYKDNDIYFEIIPDELFVNSLALGYIGGNYGDYRNLDYLVQRLLKVSGEEELAKLHQKGISDNRFKLFKISDEKSFIQAKNKTLFVLFILEPVVILLAGIFIVAKRRKHK